MTKKLFSEFTLTQRIVVALLGVITSCVWCGLICVILSSPATLSNQVASQPSPYVPPTQPTFVPLPPSTSSSVVPTPEPSVAPVVRASIAIAPNNIQQMKRVNNMYIPATLPYQIAWSRDGKKLALVQSGVVALYDAENLKVIRQFSHPGNKLLIRTAFSPDGQIVATGSLNGTIKIWEASSGRELFTLNGHTDQIQGIVFSPDGRVLFTGASDRTVRLWEISTGRLLNTLRHTDAVFDIALLPDGRQLIAGTVNGTLTLWDVITGRDLRVIGRTTKAIYSVAVSPDGSFAVLGTLDGIVRIWRTSDWSEIPVRYRHQTEIIGLAFSPDGRLLVSVDVGGMGRIWDTSTWTVVSGVSEKKMQGVTFSPDGKFLAYTTDQGVVFWAIQK